MSRAAQFGQLDDSFSRVFSDASGFISNLTDAPDGKYFVSGTFHRVGAVRRIHLARMNPDHTLDASFNARLSAVSSILKVMVQADGKPIIHGALFLADGTVLPPVTRFTVDGTVDDSFQLPPNLGSIYNVTLVPASQKIILNGLLLPTNNVASAVMIQLNTDGSIDSAFTSAIKRGPSIRIEPVAGNKLMLIGSFSLSLTTEAWETNSSSRGPRPRPSDLPPAEPQPRSPSPLRLNADGSVDGTFTNTAIPEYESIYPTPAGGIYSFLNYSTLSEGNTNAIQRFLPNGEKDLSFAPTFEAGFSISTLMPLKNGKLLVLLSRYNETETYDYILQRLADDGTVDLDYETTTTAFYSLATDRLELPDGSLLIADNSLKPSGSHKNLHKIHSDGTIETEIGPEFITYSSPSELVPTSDAKFYMVKSDAPDYRARLSRYLPDGSPDGSFYASTGETNSLDSIKLLANGDLIALATSFGSYDRTLARLNSAGDVLRQLNEGESAFYFNYGSWDAFPDGRVIVGSSGNSLEPSPLIKMFTAEFEEDPSFNSVLHTNRASFTLIATPDSKILSESYSIPLLILSAGSSSSSGEVQYFYEKFLSEGSPDPSFQPGTNRSFSSVFDAKNRMYIPHSTTGGRGSAGRGRDFREVTGNDLPSASAIPPVQRFLENGTLDPYFNVTLPANSSAYRIWVQKDGRILAAGRFYNADQTKISTLIRLLPDGTIDESFSPPPGEVVPINAIAVEADGNILIGGAFDQIDGQPRAGLARLKSIEQPQMKNLTFTSGGISLQLDGNTGYTWLIQSSPDLSTWTTISTVTTGTETETVELPAPGSGNKFYRAVLAP